MGTKQSSEEEKQTGGLFSWQRLPAPENETIHYDPRYEDIQFTDNNLLVSDYHNRVFEWEGKVDSESGEPMGYELKAFRKYKYENQSGTQAGKRFDKSATSLAWIRKTHIHYYDINTEKVYIYDVSEWMDAKYGENNTAKISQPKAIINLGNGQVLFMIVHFKGTDKTATDNKRATDIIHMDIINEKEMNTITIQTEILKNAKFQCVYWGFQLNPTGKEISVLIQGEKNVTYVLFVSLSDGNVIWQSRFDFVHDLSFNNSGKFACVFERPRKTEYGYVHVLNLTRLEWLCQIRLTYGTSPLGWDGFTWMNDSLVFMAPFELKVVSPGALEWRIRETKKENQLLKQIRDEKLKKLQQDEDEDQDENQDEQKQGDNDNNNENQPDPNANVITPQKFDEILQQQKSKEICVLSIGERWWDLEKDTMDVIYKQTSDEHISHLILEYSGLSWAMIKFPYPKDEFNKNKKDKDDPDNNKMLLQGAQSEVFQSGSCSDFSVLLLATIARDPRTNIFNHWIFTACNVPKTFQEMWNNDKIKQGIIGEITNVEEQSNLKTLDEYK